MSRSAKGRWIRVASALTLVVGIMLMVMSTVAFAQDDGGSGGVQADVVTQNVLLNNNTAPVGTGSECPADTSVSYWHFIIAPNNGTYTFVTIHLNLGTTFDFSGSAIIPNGSQTDNVFVAVPAGKALTDLQTSGSSADITPSSPAPSQFTLSHVCPATETTSTTSSTTTSSTTTSSTTTSSTTTSSTTTSSTTTSTSSPPPTSEVSPTSVVASTTTTRVAGVVVTAPPATPSSLAFTGSNDFVIPMAVLGGLMILAGLGLAFYAQRRYA